MAELLLLSDSTAPGMGFLEHATGAFKAVLGDRGSLLFVPFASSDPDTYTSVMRQVLAGVGIEVTGLHQASDPAAAVAEARAVFVGGGNAFRLLRTLTRLGVLEGLREAALAGVPYLAASAGTNLACPTIRTTNDMPIVEPGSLAALGLIPFQLNPHYLDPDPRSPHRGETRPERIGEFLEETTSPSWACAKAPGCRSLAPGHTCPAVTPAAIKRSAAQKQLTALLGTSRPGIRQVRPPFEHQSYPHSNNGGFLLGTDVLRTSCTWWRWVARADGCIRARTAAAGLPVGRLAGAFQVVVTGLLAAVLSAIADVPPVARGPGRASRWARGAGQGYRGGQPGAWMAGGRVRCRRG